jgi:hypothetical protein
MSKIAIAALVVSTLLAVFTNRWVTDPPAVGFVMVDLRWINLGIQWLGFLLAVAAMYVFFGQWRAAGQWPRLAWWGGALLAFYVVEGVPFTLDSSKWQMKNRIAAWQRGRKEEKETAEASRRFAGGWKSPSATYEFSTDSFTIRGSTGVETVSQAACEFGFMLRYRMRSRHIFPGTTEAMKYTEGLDSEMPALEATCGNADYTFLLRPDGTVAAHRMSARGEVSYDLLSR